MKSLFLLLLSLTFVLSACTDPQKEEELKRRELALQAKEQEYSSIQQDYEMLKKMRDSIINLPDTTTVKSIPEQILGRWNGKILCTESNCSEHVVGDVRTDIWEFSNDSVRIVNSNGSERMYASKLNGSELKLTSPININMPQNNKTEIFIQLPSDKLTRMKGSRIVTRDNCTAKFSVDLEKIKK